ncbi:myb-related transcription factor, partner of profilin-like, partial [Tachysurus ichikawai]
GGKESVAATGGGPSTADLTSVDSKIVAIIGEVSVCGIVSEKEGDTDVTETTEEQVLLESEAVGEQEGFSDADAQCPAQTVPLLRLARLQMREVMQEIAQSLKDAVKT